MVLFERVCNECSCGTCYDLFARGDRVPWRSGPEKGKFINARHGEARINRKCKLFGEKFSGYIYMTKNEILARENVKKMEWEMEYANQKQMIPILQKRKELEDQLEAEAVKAVKETKTQLIDVEAQLKQLVDAKEKEEAIYDTKRQHWMDLVVYYGGILNDGEGNMHHADPQNTQKAIQHNKTIYTKCRPFNFSKDKEVKELETRREILNETITKYTKRNE